MSYDVSLEHPKTGKYAEVELFSEGGTYAVGGSREASLNVTYNYCRHYEFKTLNHMPASETIKSLKDAVEKLGTQKDNDYWNSTPGNCGHACNILLVWAEQYPDYIWRVN